MEINDGGRDQNIIDICDSAKSFELQDRCHLDVKKAENMRVFSRIWNLPKLFNSKLKKKGDSDESKFKKKAKAGQDNSNSKFSRRKSRLSQLLELLPTVKEELWGCLIFLTMLIQGLLLPFETCFKIKSSLWIAKEITINILLLFDFIIELRAFKNAQALANKRHLFQIIAFHLLPVIVNLIIMADYLPAEFFLLFYLKFWKFFKILDQIKPFFYCSKAFYIISFILGKAFLIMLIVTNLGICLWHGAGFLSSEPSDSWLKQESLLGKTTYERYVYSLMVITDLKNIDLQLLSTKEILFYALIRMTKDVVFFVLLCRVLSHPFFLTGQLIDFQFINFGSFLDTDTIKLRDKVRIITQATAESAHQIKQELFKFSLRRLSEDRKRFFKHTSLLKALKKCHQFVSYSDEILRSLAEGAIKVNLRRGDRLSEEGSAKIVPNKHGGFPICSIKKGDIMGLSTFFTKKPCLYDLRASEEAKISLVDSDQFKNQLRGRCVEGLEKFAEINDYFMMNFKNDLELLVYDISQLKSRGKSAQLDVNYKSLLELRKLRSQVGLKAAQKFVEHDQKNNKSDCNRKKGRKKTIIIFKANQTKELNGPEQNALHTNEPEPFSIDFHSHSGHGLSVIHEQSEASRSKDSIDDLDKSLDSPHPNLGEKISLFNISKKKLKIDAGKIRQENNKGLMMSSVSSPESVLFENGGFESEELGYDQAKNLRKSGFQDENINYQRFLERDRNVCDSYDIDQPKDYYYYKPAGNPSEMKNKNDFNKKAKLARTLY